MPFVQDLALLLFKIGIGLSFASSIVGFLYAIRADRERPFQGANKELTVVMLAPTFFGAVVSLVGWFFAAITHPSVTIAFTGSAIVQPLEFEAQLIKAYLLSSVLFAVACLLGFFLLRYESKHTWDRYERFYGVQLLIALGFFVTPILLFRDMYGVFLSLESFATVVSGGSVVVLGFLYLRSRIEKRYVEEIYRGLSLLIRVFWFSLLLNIVLLFMNWTPLAYYSEEFIMGQAITFVLIAVALPVFQIVFPEIRISGNCRLHTFFTVGLFVIALLLAVALVVSELEFVPLFSATVLPWIAVAMVICSILGFVVDRWIKNNEQCSTWGELVFASLKR